MGEICCCVFGICGSMFYLVFEVLKKEGDYDFCVVDVWSLVVVMFYLVFGGVIWQKVQEGDNFVVNKNFNEFVCGWMQWNVLYKDVENLVIIEMDYFKVKVFDFGVRFFVF